MKTENKKRIAPIVIGGLEGSGTRVLTWMLQAFGVNVGFPLYNEMSYKHFDNFCINFWSLHINKASSISSEEIDDKLTNIFSHCQDRLGGGKSAHSIFILDLLNTVFPEFKFIYIIRDGRDIKEKFMKRGVSDFEAIDSFPLFLKTDYEKYLFFWQKTYLDAKNYLKNEMPNRWLEIKLENLVSPLTIKRNEMRDKIASFLDIPSKNFNEKVLYKITVPRSIGRHVFFPNHTPHFLKGPLNELGYKEEFSEKEFF